ncbi:MAG: hypothetical protein HDS80_00870 [Bacteroidales bacterium]|nr:hypothetical protein [Bacteroidales bacterium]
MKKNLLALGALALTCCSFVSSAKTAFYCPDIEIFSGTTTPTMVSKNGEYVVVNDGDNSKSYLWSKANPEDWQPIEVNNPALVGVNISGVSNDGKIFVGTAIVRNSDYQNSRPIVIEDGEMTVLPMHSAILNTVEVVGCNSDASILFGYQFLKDETSEIAGRYYPCLWKRNSEGEYELTAYDRLQLPAHQGFIPMDMNEDGTIICGTLWVPAGSSIPAIVENGELIYFNELDTRLEPFYYKGQIHGYYEEYYIDGYHDGATAEYFSGTFQGLDEWGNFYGHRTRAFDVITEPDKEGYGTGRLVNGACVYNMKAEADEAWHDYTNIGGFSTGLDQKYMFTNGGRVVDVEGNGGLISDEFDFSPGGLNNPCITHISADGQTLSGIHTVPNPAIGENDYFPFVIVLDEPLVDLPNQPGGGEDSVFEIVNGGENVNILLTPGRVDVAGVESAALYDINGRLVGNGTTFHVAPGLYVVSTANGAQKVLVK